MTKGYTPKTELDPDSAERAKTAAAAAQRMIAPGPGRCSSCDAEVWRLTRPSTIAGDPDRIVMFDEGAIGEGSWTISPDEGRAVYVGPGKGYMNPHSCVSHR